VIHMQKRSRSAPQSPLALRWGGEFQLTLFLTSIPGWGG
jgi:hypothetical protein